MMWLVHFLLWGSLSFAEGAPVPLVEKQAHEIENYKQKSNDLKEKEREVLSHIYKMSLRQRRLANQKAEQLQKREELEADIAHLQKNVEQVSEQIHSLKRKLVVRVRNLHRIDTPTIFQSIFGAQDVTEMDRNARTMYKISQADVEQLRTFRGLRNLLDQQQQELEHKLVEFEKTQKSLDTQDKAIKNNYLAQMTLLKKLSSEGKQVLAKLRGIRKRAGSQLAADHEELLENGFLEMKNQLELPVNGVVTQRFGLLRLPREKVRVYHKGWFISTAPLKETSAVYRGRVAYVGEMGEFHRLVIVDHGDHFYSIYANLSEFFVKEGDQVEPQQALGSVDTSRFFGPGLYFEIRHFSQSEDPAEWIKNSAINLSSLKEQNL